MGDIEILEELKKRAKQRDLGINSINYYYALEHVLKERKAKPIEPIQENINDVILWHCGKCGFYIARPDNFCSHCGRAVEWE